MRKRQQIVIATQNNRGVKCVCVGVIVDATSITKFQCQRINEGGGPAVDNLEKFLENGFIFMDKGRIMEQEWMGSGSYSTHERGNLQDWIADLQQSGRIKMRDLAPNPALRKRLSAFGRLLCRRLYSCSEASSSSFEPICGGD